MIEDEPVRKWADIKRPGAINNTKWIGVLGFLGRDFLIRRDRARDNSQMACLF